MLWLIIEQKGHGIPDSLLKEVKEQTRKFFQLPYEEKLKIKLTAAAGYRCTYAFLLLSVIAFKFYDLPIGYIYIYIYIYILGFILTAG